MKYRLNFDWLIYKKGDIFETDEQGHIRYTDQESKYVFYLYDISLLLLSGALTEVKENTCMHHTNPYNCDCFKNLGKEKEEECPQLPEKLEHFSHMHLIIDAINQLTTYLKHKEK